MKYAIPAASSASTAEIDLHMAAQNSWSGEPDSKGGKDQKEEHETSYTVLDGNVSS